MVCEKCGAHVDENMKFCTVCGQPLMQSAKPPHKNRKWLWAVCIAAVAVVGIAAFFWSYLRPIPSLADEKIESEYASLRENRRQSYADERTRPSTPRVTAPPANPSPSLPAVPEAGGSVSIPLEPDYLEYVDYVYQYHCAYPAHFIAEETSGTERLRLAAPDGSCTMTIHVESASAGAAEEMNLLIASGSYGESTYSAHGDTWYACSFDNGETFYYRKCFVENGLCLWFDMSYPRQYDGIYQAYINYIEDNFKMQ